jgi:uncharacterized OB-fold protein
MFTVVHQTMGLAKSDAADALALVAVELTEQPGLRYLSTVVGCAPEDVFIGMPVKLVWTKRDGSSFPAFAPNANPGRAGAV